MISSAREPPAYFPLVDPIFEYDRTWGQSISGGYVYRGLGDSFYRGRYFFADFVRGRVWSIAINPATGQASDVIEHTAELGGAAVLGNISSFGVDARGELYILNYSQGTVVRIVTPPGSPTGIRIVEPGD